LNPPRSLSSLDRYRRRSCTDRFSSQRHSHRRRRRTRTATAPQFSRWCDSLRRGRLRGHSPLVEGLRNVD